MEKAFQQKNGICYAEYNLSLEKRLEVEQARDDEYKKLKNKYQHCYQTNMKK